MTNKYNEASKTGANMQAAGNSKRIAEKITTLQKIVEELHATVKESSKAEWPSVGSLGYIEEQLDNILDGFSLS